MTDNFEEFCKNFNIVENAMDMRTLIRWNGRDLREKENLAEHTHLVVACIIELYDEFNEKLNECGYEIVFEDIIRAAMLHDSLELLRGDILSVTKDIVPKLRYYIDEEETKFIFSQKILLSDIETILLKLADLKACYKFIERELRYPSNDFALNVYKTTKQKYDEAYKDFCEKYLPNFKTNDEVKIEHKFVKGYYDDAGSDVILTEKVTFMPMTTTKIDLKVQVTPKENEMGFLCSRTSAAAKGLIVAMCPIDPNFNGNVTAIVHNISNSIVEYNKGEAFCQVVQTPFVNNTNVFIKKEGKRSSGKLGSTGI